MQRKYIQIEVRTKDLLVELDILQYWCTEVKVKIN